ncbi:MAG: 2-succinyl-5-enolpyruvyl-6-hydroxy-3-cyclohexene-1-carboxylic-acid synthase [Kineosporiaceae bacterium]|nr:2-succinyl-5-enolpyruvyl-6-hydroxy-3-cyclohexene-1-carboxylic-acid synthase [Kineosporiaceae bacterium]
MTSSQAVADAAVSALVGAGVRHVVLCPGSRSAPLAYRLADAHQAGLLTVWVRHDERVAAFTALGMARAGAPAAVVTTSGTAVANLHPAVLEAHHGGVPLIVISADRPPALRGTWANQTTELQSDLFGAALRARLDTVHPDAGPMSDALAAARGTAGRRPGPVHLNLCLEEPLVPAAADPGAPRPPEPPAITPWSSAPARSVTTLPAGPRTVVVAGDGAGRQARDLAEAAGWPLLAEPSSGARGGPRVIGPYRLLLELPELGEAIERVVVLGRPTLSRPVTRVLARPDVEVVLASPHPHWPVPPRAVHRVDLVEPAPGGPGDRDRDWSDRWTTADVAARAALDGLLDAETRPTGLTLARALARALQPGESLIAASSNPIRDLDLAGGALPEGVRVLANRGLAGIDGTVSTAIGHVLASGRPTRALVGDLAFLHDAGALLAPLGERRPQLQVVVLNDAGGGIFSLLEYGELAERDPTERERFDLLFGTPHAADLAALCRGYGVPHRRIDTLAELDAALARPHSGISVVEVPANRDTLRARHEAIRAAVGAAVRAAVEAAGVSAPPAPAAPPNP